MTERWDTGMSPEEEQELKAAMERAAEIETNRLQRMQEQAESEEGFQPPQEPEPEEDFDPLDDPSLPGFHYLGDYERLCQQGYQEKTIQLGGQDITFRTINQEEELTALRLSDRWSPTVRARVFTLYCLAQGMIAINRKKWFSKQAISEDQEDEILYEKLLKLSKLHSPFLNVIIDEYRSLERELVEKAIYAKKESEGGMTSGPTSEESTEKVGP